MYEELKAEEERLYQVYLVAEENDAEDRLDHWDKWCVAYEKVEEYERTNLS